MGVPVFGMWIRMESLVCFLGIHGVCKASASGDPVGVRRWFWNGPRRCDGQAGKWIHGRKKRPMDVWRMIGCAILLLVAVGWMAHRFRFLRRSGRSLAVSRRGWPADFRMSLGRGFRCVGRGDETGFLDAFDLGHAAIVNRDLDRAETKVGDIVANDFQPIGLGALRWRWFRWDRAHWSLERMWQVGKARRGNHPLDPPCDGWRGYWDGWIPGLKMVGSPHHGAFSGA